MSVVAERATAHRLLLAGVAGPALFVGHADTRTGPSVFHDLGRLKPKQLIEVGRADGSTAVFAVDRVVSYPKTQFPTEEVYGDTDHAALRLVTCGGAFDEQARSYLENVVVYASLVGGRST